MSNYLTGKDGSWYYKIGQRNTGLTCQAIKSFMNHRLKLSINKPSWPKLNKATHEEHSSDKARSTVSPNPTKLKHRKVSAVGNFLPILKWTTPT